MNQITGLPENCCDSEDNNDLEDNLEYPHNAFLGTSKLVKNNDNIVSLMTIPNTVGSFLIKKSPPEGLHLRYKATIDYMTNSSISFTVKFDIHIPDTGITWPLAVVVLNANNTHGSKVPIFVDFNVLCVSGDSIKYDYNIQSDNTFYRVLTNTYTNVGMFAQYNFRPEINTQLQTTLGTTEYNVLWNTLTV